jgi:ribonuclease HIII
VFVTARSSSDGKVNILAIEIDRIARRSVAVTILEPEEYNRKFEALKRDGKNSTDLLAWAHARCIEALALGDFRQRPKSVLIDRFATRLLGRAPQLERV